MRRTLKTLGIISLSFSLGFLSAPWLTIYIVLHAIHA